MRTALVFFPKSSVCKACMTFARAATFSDGATESSRSRNTRSAALWAAFAIMRSLLAGVDNSDRLKRIGSPPSRLFSRFIIIHNSGKGCEEIACNSLLIRAYIGGDYMVYKKIGRASCRERVEM